MEYNRIELERFCAILRSLSSNIQPMRSGKSENKKSTVYNLDNLDVAVLTKFREFYELTENALSEALAHHG